MIGVPRIQARTGQVTESPEDPSLIGKWSFEIHVSFMGSGQDKMVFPGPLFDTEDEAKREMRKAAELVVREVSKKIKDADPEKYIDLKTNEVRNWQEN